ncbi:hypothetical protein P6709_10250 [Jeotgalibacillus sp. ET6]|uniref:hypothetical protein n=1 Tax=Jeotgalibacillus sp. ET6 TaxID=3037260 RepID=UPI00241890F3|nr:hypothetical protein [Jeotgalibacillus sp. ET6]MDG5472132.1 hypothetical protein [Jeotgalibacillus sp. ET6]
MFQQVLQKNSKQVFMISQVIVAALLALSVYLFFTKEAPAAKILAALSFAGNGVLFVLSLIGSYRMKRNHL